MRRLAGIGLALCPLVALAQTPDAAAPAAAPPAAAPPPAAEQAAPANTWLARPVAELQALDKITARVTPLTVKTGQSATFGALTITVRFCMVRPPDVAADTAMFLDIADANPAAPQFHGWMLLSAPSVNLLQHPVYDIRPAACHA